MPPATPPADAVPELILAHLKEIVEDAVDITVHRSRDAALSEKQLPSINLLPLVDVPSEDNGSVCWMNWTFSVAYDIIVGDGMDTAAHPYRAAIYAAVMADRELSPVAGVIDVTPAPVPYQLENRVGDFAFVRVPFTIRYRTKHDDLTVAP
jgi:hypothetical protein